MATLWKETVSNVICSCFIPSKDIKCLVYELYSCVIRLFMAVGSHLGLPWGVLVQVHTSGFFVHMFITVTYMYNKFGTQCFLPLEKRDFLVRWGWGVGREVINRQCTQNFSFKSICNTGFRCLWAHACIEGGSCCYII